VTRRPIPVADDDVWWELSNADDFWTGPSDLDDD
jgi:hypothetical protein